MTHTERTLLLSLLITFAALCASVTMNLVLFHHFRTATKMVRTDTVTNTVYVEKTDTAPAMTAEKVTGHVNISDVPLHVPYNVSRNAPNHNTSPTDSPVKPAPSLFADSGNKHETEGLFPESDTLPPASVGFPDGILPIIQKTYQDSTYTAYVSGIKYNDFPRLDSVRVRERTVYQTITMTKEAQRKRKRWSVGVTGGYGYGLTSKQVEPHIGVGVSYSMFSF